MREPEWTLKFLPFSPVVNKPKVIFLPNSRIESMSDKEIREWLLRLHHFFQEILIATNNKDTSIKESLERVQEMTRALKEIHNWINKKYGQDRPKSL